MCYDVANFCRQNSIGQHAQLIYLIQHVLIQLTQNSTVDVYTKT